MGLPCSGKQKCGWRGDMLRSERSSSVLKEASRRGDSGRADCTRKQYERRTSICIDDYRPRGNWPYLKPGQRSKGACWPGRIMGATEQRLLCSSTKCGTHQAPGDGGWFKRGNFIFPTDWCVRSGCCGRRRRPLPFFACNDDMAGGDYPWTRKFVLRLPGQLSVTGF